MDFASREAKLYPELSSRYEILGSLASKASYHELTEELRSFVRDPNCRKQTPELNLPKLYYGFIQTFQDKLNPLKLVLICTDISSQYEGKSEAQEFLEKIYEKMNAHTAYEAKLLCQMQINRYKLFSGTSSHAQVKEVLDTNLPIIEGLVGAEPTVHAAYYRVACDYFSAVGPAEKFYKSALMYLAYKNYEDMPQEERFDLAINLSIAAMTGDGVFNFGEVLATPILKALEGSSKQWLSDLLHVFNRGDIDQYNEIVSQHSDEYFAQPALVSKSDYVKEKMALLALMRLIFQSPSHERVISLNDIAEVTRLKIEQVEWLLMRALSCELVKGSIDQVDEVFRVTWVQPRVLDHSQLKALAYRFEEWEKKVHSTLEFVEEQTPELFQ